MGETRSPELEGLDEEERADAIERWVDSLEDESSRDGDPDEETEDGNGDAPTPSMLERLAQIEQDLGMVPRERGEEQEVDRGTDG